jgi:hypothetical protein
MATNMATTLPTGVWQSAGSGDIAEWQKWYGQNVGKTINVNGSPQVIGRDVDPGQLWDAFRSNSVNFTPQAQPQISSGTTTTDPNAPQPESVALQQMAQIDPQSEALRQGLAGSYLSQVQAPLPKQGPPSAADLQSYLNTYQQVDPSGFAARQQLQSDLAQQEALGTQLDPETIRELTQSTRNAQLARGNVYGTPQLVQEAMTRGQAGLALQQQRQAAMQGFLQSGQDIGSVGANLYQQGLANYFNQMANYRAGQGAALGYLGSGQTPYQAGASYLNTAENRANAASQGGPVFSPQGPSSYYTGAGASSFPQYGLDMSQLSNQWLQGLNYGQYAGYNAQLAASQAKGGGGFSGMGAAKGAMSGAASGALAGSVIPGIGTAVGAIGGGLLGGLGGGFSG